MTVRFPVAVWQDFAGSYTASVLDGASLAAYDRTAAGALAQLERYLAWAVHKETFKLGDPDFADLRLLDYRVVVRPEYRIAETTYPVPATLNVRVACVDGKRRDGTRQCVAPTQAIRLSYQTGDPIAELMTESLQQALGRRAPHDLSRELMPPRITLDAIHIRQRHTARRDATGRFPALQAIATPLGGRRRGAQEARAIARDDEVRIVVEHLNGNRGNILLLGEASVGKSTVLHQAVQQLLRTKTKDGEPAESDKVDLRRRQFWRTSGQRLIAGMKYLGQWEERCELAIGELAIGELAETGSVLCVEELLDLVRVGGREPGSSVAAFFQPYLERGELRMVAEATSAELDACRRLLPGFADLFQIVRVPEFSPINARTVLDRLLVEGARNLKMDLESGLADVIYRLFRRFQPYAAFPGRSAAFVRHLLDHAARRIDPATAAANTPRSPGDPPSMLTADDVMAEFQRETGMPGQLLRDDVPLPHEQVLAAFRQAVLGQEAACQAAAGVVATLKTGLNDPHRPLGVLLFCGPTGVGKTEMAKALARYLFGTGDAADRLLRLDMSEYSGPGAAQRLMMASDGGPSDFIKRARRQPFSVVLLDEIEKAAPQVHDALLGVLDEGRLTDHFGRVTTFGSAVIVMTSNVGADRAAHAGFDAHIQPPFERIVLDHFRPEFVNRIDAIVTFQPLDRQTITRLVVRELESLGQREGIANARLRLAWDQNVIEHLATAGLDARYGARPLHRAIERLVVAPLARWLLKHPTTAGTIVLHLDGDEIRCRQA